MEFIDSVIEKAKKDVKRIVLPEATDVRVLKAASKLQKEAIANIVLIGNADKINAVAQENNIDITGVEIQDPKLSEKHNEYANALYELRKAKGMTEEQANELAYEDIHFGILMLYKCDADGLVCGAIHSTADTLRPALQILKTAPNTKLVSGFFVMDVPGEPHGGVYVFGDCGLNVNPNSDELSEIAIASAKSYEELVGNTAKVGMLSYSTHGSAKSDLVTKVVEATELVKQKNPNLDVEGELQLDAAIVPEVAKLKAPDSTSAGYCNTLIFPDLDAGNIGYKLVQRFANAKAYGPLCQGIAKPVNDLSRGCSADDIVGVVAITAVQAQKIN